MDGPGAEEAEPRIGGYAALRGYAGIGDGRTVALIARDGRIDWLPVPSLDGRPVFGALLDERSGGRFELRPVEPFSTTRAYVDGTNVLRTRFTTASGAVDVTDALGTGVAGRLPWTELIRRIDGVEGEVEMAWAVIPGDVLGDDPVRRFDTGNVPLLRIGTVNLALVGVDHGRTDPVHRGDGRATDGGPEFRGRFTTTPGSRSILCLCGTEDEPVHVPDPRITDEGIDRTIGGWQRWTDEFAWQGPWQDAVLRSALALKLLIQSPSGTIAAAATTSLPERMRPGKNYDYRFAWVRDLAYTVDALLRFGLREEPHAAVAWVLKALKANGGEMAVLLTFEAQKTDAMRRVRAEGWRGVGPVVSGNRAGDQLQLGTYADLLAVLQAYTAQGNPLDATSSDLLVALADDVCRRWRDRDSGMWELTEQRHYVSSKMGCWQALDAAIRLHDGGYLAPRARTRRRWERHRARIRRWIDRHGWNEQRGAYVMAKGSRELDTSVLLHAVSGFDRGERMSRTVDAIQAELGAGPLLWRYSGMQREEGTFTACGFWLASALACVGRVDEAVERMDRLVTVANDVGLMSEMIDPDSGDFLGNLPQALSHLALVNAATVIADLSEKRVRAE